MFSASSPRSHDSTADSRKTPVAAESNVGNAPGPRLGPDPVRPHAESLGDLLGGQQPVHGVQVADAFIYRQVWDGSVDAPFRYPWATIERCQSESSVVQSG